MRCTGITGLCGSPAVAGCVTAPSTQCRCSSGRGVSHEHRKMSGRLFVIPGTAVPSDPDRRPIEVGNRVRVLPIPDDLSDKNGEVIEVGEWYVGVVLAGEVNLLFLQPDRLQVVQSSGSDSGTDSR